MNADQYTALDLLAAGQLKVATEVAEKQLTTLASMLWSESPSGGSEKRKLVDLVFEAKKQAEEARVEAARDYRKLAGF